MKHRKVTQKSRRPTSPWLRRQLRDPFVKRRQVDQYVSRSAYKLEEIDDRYHLFQPGSHIVDLGSAPGGWSQVMSRRATESHQLYAVDKLVMQPIPRVKFVQCDFIEDQQRIIQEIPKPLHVILSDMSPNLTGEHYIDHACSVELCYSALEFASYKLRKHGSLVFKVFMGVDLPTLIQDTKKVFRRCSCFKPKSSRPDSSEIYYVCQDFLR